MNLFKREPLLYLIKSTDREVYETERYYSLKVVDFSRCLEKEVHKMGWTDGIGEFLEMLFESQKNLKLSNTVTRLFDTNRFEVVISKFEKDSRTSVAVVEITKRRIRDKIAGKVFVILKIIFDRDYNYYNF